MLSESNTSVAVRIPPNDQVIVIANRIGNNPKREKPNTFTRGRYRQKVRQRKMIVSPKDQQSATPENATPYNPNPIAVMTHVIVMGETNRKMDE